MHPVITGIGLATSAMMLASSSLPPAVHMRMAGSGKDCWVLVHAFGTSGRAWEKRGPSLAARHHVRVYYPDMPSHGLSAFSPTFNYTMATDALQTALKDVCPKPKVVVGIMTGGIVAMRLAARMHSRAIGVSVGWSLSDANLKDLIDSSEHPSPTWMQIIQTFAEQGQPQIDTLVKFTRRLADIGTNPMLTPQEARALRGRLLVIHADNDDFFSKQSAAELVRKVPGAQLYRFPNAATPVVPPYVDVVWQLIDRYGDTGTIGRSPPLSPAEPVGAGT